MKQKINNILCEKSKSDASVHSIENYFKKYDYNLYLEITNLFNDYNLRFCEKIYWILNDISIPPKCLHCNKLLKMTKFQSGYGIFCSKKCRFHNNTYVNYNNISLYEYDCSIDLKQQLTKLLRTDGKINSCILRQRAYLNSSLNKKIISETAFLSDNATYSERFYCINNDIKSLQSCSICGNVLKFSKQRNEYLYACSVSCIRKIRMWKSSSDNKKKTTEEIYKSFEEYYHNNNYVNISIEDILKFINDRCEKTNNGISHAFSDTKILNENKDIICNIIKLTEYIKFETVRNDLNISQRFYHIINKLSHRQLCKCGNELYYRDFRNGYLNNCKRCGFMIGGSNRAKNHIERIKTIISKRYIIHEIPNQLNSGYFTLECNKCNHIDRYELNSGRAFKYIHCKNCESYCQTQREIYNIVKQRCPDAIFNDRSLGFEIDIYIPSKKIGIEYHGLYWHRESDRIDKNYHKNKYLKCKEHNIRLIQIFEDEWMTKSDIVINRLKYILGVTNNYKLHARKCEIREINNTLKDKFLEKYHIQGKDKSSIRLGAFYKNRLIAIMTFGNTRKALGHKSNVNEYELIRFATIAHFNINGIGSKLFQYFIKRYNPSVIISFSDIRWNTGKFYEIIGMKLDHISKPNYWYFNKQNMFKRYHRFNFRKQLLKYKLNNYNNDLTEWQNMQLNGYYRIWDCGNLVFKWMK
ncbi:MAG: hypothetical protein K9L64_04300 [Candidatus Izimaplasma sp.]|nr:hypothetical protein [Candidatus Izimaplasma bacterium]MCF7927427.1 hypothetical protein [Candidatus Izimaplasma bacterium]